MADALTLWLLAQAQAGKLEPTISGGPPSFTGILGQQVFDTKYGVTWWYDGSTWHSDGLGRVLGETIYAPSTWTGFGVVGALAAFSSANLTVSFVVPPSGNVMACASFFGNVSGSAEFGFGFVTHGTSTAIGTWWAIGKTTGDTEPFTMRCSITGLTPGATYQIDLAGASSVSSYGYFMYIQGYSGFTSPINGFGPCIITVEAR
jgi:hypothetical protein